MNRRPLLISIVALLGGALGVQETEKDALQAQVEELQGRVDQIEVYLQQQAKAGEGLSQALSAAQQAGFTYGINPESREILLEGLGGVAKAAKEKVPGKAAPEPVEPKSQRGVRRGE